ncbi:MAG: hypothetical protein KatS3mg127_1612 [Silanimonas sp.]|nr:MAG: hypothetical protein KatS3mg127_1612 [Silanimonas sp.]
MAHPVIPHGTLLAAFLCCTACAVGDEGEIGGRIAFPGEAVPAMTLVLLERNDPIPRRVPIAAGQERYSFRVAPGTHTVFAIPEERPDPLLVGAHSRYSVCNARQRAGAEADGGCRTGPPREVVVAGARIEDVDIDGWYLEEPVASALLALAGDGE